MNIGIASSGLGHVARGVEAWAAELARALAERGVAVSLYKGGGKITAPYERIVPCWRRESIQARQLLHFLPRAVGWRLGLGSAYQIEQTTFALRLLPHLRRERIDLLHVQDPLVALIVQRARRIGWLGTRAILAHGTEEPVSFLAKIDHVQHLAPWHQAQAAGAAKSAWTTIPNFVDTEHFCPGRPEALRDELEIPQDALVVLCVAAIKRRHKRIDFLLDEFARLRRAQSELPAWLVVAGGHEADTGELVERGRQMLGDRVRFLVDFPRVGMPELYRSADLFALASLKEMMPLALLEATASGLPCLVNDHPVLRWMAGAGGKTIDMAKVGALAVAMGQMLGDPEGRANLAESARQHCLENFSRDRVVDQIVGYYERVLGQGLARNSVPYDRRKSDRAVGHAIACRHSVSVIIPTYNSATLVTQAIDSVLAQTTPPAEILVVDDGSSDDTRAALERYAGRIRYLHQENQGVAAARNRGLREATGKLIAFLDADDVWHPRKLELQLAILRQNSRLGLLGTAAVRWPEQSFGALNVASWHPIPWDRLAVRNYFIASSVVVRKAIVDRVGGFDPALHGPEDYDLWLRVAERATVGNVELPLTGYRTVPGSLSKQAGSMEAGMRQILRMVEHRAPWLLRRKAHAYCDYSCAFMYAAVGNYGRAIWRMVRSLTTYPLPFHRSEIPTPWGRIKRLAAMMLRSPMSRRGRDARAAMRVVHVVLSLDCGGLERVVLDLVRSGQALGQDVWVICLERQGIWAEQARSLGARVLCMNKMPGVRPGVVFKLIRAFHSFKPDVVHSHQIGALFYAGPAAHLAGVAHVVHTQHGKQLDLSARAQIVRRLAARFAQRFFCVSEDIAQDVVARRVAPAAKVAVVRNGIDIAFRQGADDADLAQLPAGAVVVGTIGRLSAVKQQDLLLRAFTQVSGRFPTAHLLVVGDGPLRQELELLSRTLGAGLEGRIHLVGYQAEPERFLRRMDVVAMTSRSEGLPLAVLEAWANGLPVVASRVGGVPELVEHEQTGLLFEAGNVDELAQAICRLIADRPLAQRLGAAGRRRVEAHFTRQRMASDYHGHYLASMAA